MIFKQVDEILRGDKTQTRRTVKPDERGLRWELDSDELHHYGQLYEVDTRRKKPTAHGFNWQRKVVIGHTYAVVPGRGKPTVHYRHAYNGTYEWKAGPMGEYSGWKPLRIRITAIRREPLQDITEADAKAEGVESVAAYRELWERINGAGSWDQNPDVWVYAFEVVT